MASIDMGLTMAIANFVGALATVLVVMRRMGGIIMVQGSNAAIVDPAPMVKASMVLTAFMNTDHRAL